MLEDGTVLPGTGVGASGVAAGEACFTTAMAGYEEAVTDPSYVAQVLCFAYPLVGTYGVDEARMESERVQCEAVIMREARPAFADWLRSRGVVALSGVDTRTLVKRIRNAHRPLRCALGDGDPDALLARALAEPPIDGRPLDRAVGTEEPYSVGVGPRVVVVDLGSKRSIPTRLAAAGVEACVVPRWWDADAILEARPRAVLVANGPGDPAVLVDQVETIRALLGQVPVYGICLGHQLLGLALGHETFTLPFGHRGANHPVRDLATGRVLVTVQNHGFAVLGPGGQRTIDGDEAVRWETDFGAAELQQLNLYDRTVEGLILRDVKGATAQYHPEAGPGPHDAVYLFDRYLELIGS